MGTDYRVGVTATTIFLARHGETDWNRDGRFQGHADPPLNAAGRAQAAELAERLAGGDVSALYTSDLRRALDTATVVGARLGLETRVHVGLREIDVGAWSGLTREEVAERFPASFARWREGAEPPEWESRAAFVARVGSALREIAAAHQGARLVAVGHGGTIRAAERHAGLSPSWPIENCSVTAFVVANGRLEREAGAP